MTQQTATPPGTGIALNNEQAMAEYEKMLAEQAATLKDRIGAPASNRIITKGKKFTTPDGVSNPGPMRVVVLDWAAFNTFYDGQYNPNNPKPPSCFAVGDRSNIAPGDKVENPQAPACAGCPKNEWGSDPNGGKGKACKNQYRVAIIPADLETPDADSVYLLQVSPTGMKAFDGFVRKAARDLQQLPLALAVDIGFDPNVEYPTLTFGNYDFHNIMPVALQLRDHARELLEREPDYE